MTGERRSQIVLAALVAVLVGVLYRQLAPAGEPGGPPEAVRSERDGGRRLPVAAAVAAPDVRLEALDRERVSPGGGDRNPFRFRRQAAASASAAPAGRLPVPPPVAPVRSGPTTPGVPPIALKFIGLVQATEQSQTFAVLRDDRGVYHGREGDIIEGRYRILRIGPESVDLAYIDGQGRQTIRLGS